MALVLLLWNKPAKNANYRLFGSIFLFLIFFVGCFRDTTIGTDIALNDDGYHMLWRQGFGYYRDIEPCFVWLTSIIKYLLPSYYLYYGIIFVINIYLYCKAGKLLKINCYLLIAIILLGGLLAYSFNVIRQMFALSLVLYIYAFINRKYEDGKISPLKATIIFEALIIVAAILFHKSLVLLCVVPVFYLEAIKKLLNKDIVLWILLVTALFLNLAGGEYIKIAVAASEGYFGERADMYVTSYMEYSEAAKATHGYITNIINGALAILLSRKHRDSLFYIGFIGMLLSGVSAANLGTIGRVFDNLSIFLLFYYAKYWFDFDSIKPLGKATWFLKALRILFWMTSLYFTLLTNASLNPYKTYLF